MSDDMENDGGVGVLGGATAVAGGVATGVGISRYMGGKHFENLPQNVKDALTKEKIDATVKAGEDAFGKIKGAESAKSYFEVIKTEADALKAAHGDKLTEYLAKDTNMEPHLRGAVTEYLKEGSTAEKVFEAGKKAHVEAHVATAEKGLLSSIETHLKDAAKSAGKEAPKMEEITKVAEKTLANSKKFATSGFIGKTTAGFKGMGTGGKIGTTIGAVVAALAIGFGISRLSGGSHAEQLQNSRDSNGQQAAPAR